MTQKQIILKVLEDNDGNWVPSYDLIKTKTDYGWLGTSADRTARRMAEEGKIELDGMYYFIERKKNGKYAYYRMTSKVHKPVEQYTIDPVTRLAKLL